MSFRHVTMLTACALAFLSHLSDPPQLETMLLIVASVVFGFFAANYPFGQIFLEETGAFLLGHTLCWIAIAILTLRPDISPFAILLIFFQPVADILLAIWRWKFNRTATYQSDRLHFHQLVMRYLEIRFLGRQKRRLSNPLTLIVIAPMLLLPQALGLIYAYDHQKAVIATLLMSALFIVTCVTGIRQAKNVSKNVSLARRVLSTIAAE